MKKFFNEAKSKYENIVASDKLKMEVSSAFEKKNMHYGKAIASVASIAALTFIVGVNTNPVFAKNMSDIPVVGKIVNVLTGYKYEFKEENYSANIEVPKIEGIINKELQEKINAEIENNANNIICQFESDMKKMSDSGMDGHLGVDSGYIIKADTDDVLSFDMYVVNIVGSSSTVHKFYNIDKKKGELITLDSLFKDNENYIEIINEYIRNEINRRNGDEEVFWIDEFKGISSEQNFYIDASENVVIVFDKYEIAPGYMGTPEFKLPKDLVK